MFQAQASCENDLNITRCREEIPNNGSITRIVLTGTMTAVSLGLGLSTLSAIIYGTAGLPFVIFSTVGFAIGAFGFYRDAMNKAVLALHRCPLLLRLHMHANFPQERFDTWTVALMRSTFQKDNMPHWKLSSMLVTSWMTATPALDVSARYMTALLCLLLTFVQRIMELEEEAIVNSEVERQAWKESDR